jgi:hypothetical protein
VKMVNLFMRVKTYLPFSSIVESNSMPFQLFVGERNRIEFYHFTVLFFHRQNCYLSGSEYWNSGGQRGMKRSRLHFSDSNKAFKTFVTQKLMMRLHIYRIQFLCYTWCLVKGKVSRNFSPLVF